MVMVNLTFPSTYCVIDRDFLLFLSLFANYGAVVSRGFIGIELRVIGKYKPAFLVSLVADENAV